VSTAEQPRWRRLGPDQRREEIFACAQRLFGEKPYAEVSTTDIAREAGIARGLLNHYFGTKRDLYLEVVREAATVPEIAVAQLPAGTIEERIDAAVTWFLDSLEAQGGTWLNVGPSSEPDLMAILAQSENESVDRLMRVLDLGEDTEHTLQVRAVIRSFGQLARASGREWLVRGTLSRAQVHDLQVAMLLTIVREVLPAIRTAD
jgi:AcrR family transcriptional regulator